MENDRDEELKLINYVCEHFTHLMTEVEREALRAIVLYVVSGEHRQMEVTFAEDVSDATIEKVNELLKDGQQTCRERVKNRLIKDFTDEIFANKCPKCDKLPRTPKSKQCLYCHHSWHTN